MPEDTLREALDKLVASGLIVRRGKPPEVTYSFKHALVQDAAYGSLIRNRRQQLHADIARVLQQKSPETAEKDPEVLAHHFTQARLVEPAVEDWEKAGQRALMRSATAEAAADLRKPVEMLLTLPDAPERTRRELDLQIALGGALLATKGYAAPRDRPCLRPCPGAVPARGGYAPARGGSIRAYCGAHPTRRDGARAPSWPRKCSVWLRDRLTILC